MCLWKRPERLPAAVDMLSRQVTDRPIRLILWNNDARNRQSYHALLNGLAERGSLSSIELVNSPVNVGGAARFLVARKAWKEGCAGPFIMIDDDQDFGVDFVDALLSSWSTHTYAGVWAWLIRGDYWDREGIEPGEKASYVGTGGSVCDVELLAHDSLIRSLRRRYLFLEDMTLSALAHREGYFFTRARADFTFDDSDTLGQWVPAQVEKSRYFDALGRPGVVPR